MSTNQRLFAKIPSLACGLAVWLLFFIWGISSGRAESRVWTLHACLDAALGRSPVLESARFDLLAATANISLQKASLLPSLSLSVVAPEMVQGSPVTVFTALSVAQPENGVTVGNGQGGQVNRAPTAHWVSVGFGSLDLNYPIFKNGSFLELNTPPAVDMARAQKRQQEWTMHLSEQMITNIVANAFFTAVWYQQKLAVDQRKVTMSEERLELYKSLQSNDLKLLQDVQLAQATLTADRSVLYATRQRTQESLSLLGRLIGAAAPQSLRLDSEPPPAPRVPPLQTLEDQVARRHPSVSVQLEAIKIATQNYRLAQSAMLPTVGLDASYSAVSKFDFQHVPNVFLAGIRVDVPIFDFGAKLNATREARYKLYSSRAQLRKVQEDLQSAIASTLEELHGIEETIASLERDYVQAKNALTLARSQNAQGMVTRLMVLDATYAVLTVEEELEGQRLAERLKYAYLQSITGGVWHWL